MMIMLNMSDEQLPDVKFSMKKLKNILNMRTQNLDRLLLLKSRVNLLISQVCLNDYF